MTLTSLEFYSGIGGMHYGLTEARPDSKVLAAFDINTTANMIYQHNFPGTKLCQNNIEAISVAQLDKWNADLWTMSPPCQPFTKKGLQLGEQDRRTDSFFALLEKLGQLSRPPRYLFVENVVGFETSSVHDEMMKILNDLGYSTQEFIITPLQLGVPNTRPRYYLLAGLERKLPEGPISTEPPVSVPVTPSPISQFIDFGVTAEDSLFLDLATISKYAAALDLITEKSERSACFTKSYGSYVSGCGSYYCSDQSLVEGNRLSPGAMELAQESGSPLPKLIRRLAPNEVARLMCFPDTFCQPPTATRKQMYRTLGNSVNVRVIATLLDYLLNN